MARIIGIQAKIQPPTALILSIAHNSGRQGKAGPERMAGGFIGKNKCASHRKSVLTR